MNDAIYNDTITIVSYETKQVGQTNVYKLVTDKNQYFDLWQTKRDGMPTKAFEAFCSIGEAGLPMTVDVGYTEKTRQYEKDGEMKTATDKTIISMTKGSISTAELEARMVALENRVAQLESRTVQPTVQSEVPSVPDQPQNEYGIKKIASQFGGTVTSQTPASSPMVEGDAGFTDVSQIPF